MLLYSSKLALLCITSSGLRDFTQSLYSYFSLSASRSVNINFILFPLTGDFPTTYFWKNLRLYRSVAPKSTKNSNLMFIWLLILLRRVSARCLFNFSRPCAISILKTLILLSILICRSMLGAGTKFLAIESNFSVNDVLILRLRRPVLPVTLIIFTISLFLLS